MTDKPTDLDEHRGLLAKKETEQRRTLIGVQQDQIRLKTQHEALEHFLAATPAQSWSDAVDKARYLIGLFAHTPEGLDPRHATLISAVLDDFTHLLAAEATGNDNKQ